MRGPPRPGRHGARDPSHGMGRPMDLRGNVSHCRFELLIRYSLIRSVGMTIGRSAILSPMPTRGYGMGVFFLKTSTREWAFWQGNSGRSPRIQLNKSDEMLAQLASTWWTSRPTSAFSTLLHACKEMVSGSAKKTCVIIDVASAFILLAEPRLDQYQCM
jgi:hypothetical protein